MSLAEFSARLALCQGTTSAGPKASPKNRELYWLQKDSLEAKN
jgi:hypothetical protein